MFKSCKLLLPVFAGILYLGCSEDPDDSSSGQGKTTRYWDACKPSCAWPGKPSNGQGTAKSCNISGEILSNANERNSCDGGTSFTCMDQVPWKVDDSLSYGFAASHTDADCGKCYQLQFTSGTVSGKTMIVMISNIGGDVGSKQFDLMIPGGGVGIYDDAFSSQITHNGGTPDLGDQYGGFRSSRNGGCGNNKSCIQDKCNSNFGTPALADSKRGCDWYVDWFNIADNPKVNYKQVNCPQELIDRYSKQ